MQAAVMLGLTVSIQADTWRDPTPFEVRSPDGRWLAHIKATSPLDNTDPIKPKATLTHVDGSTQTYELFNAWRPVDAILLNSGHLITLDDWYNMGYSPGVMGAYDTSGALLWYNNLNDLLGRKLAETAPRTASSITWRKTPLEWSYSADGSAISIALYDNSTLIIRLSDGLSKRVLPPGTHAWTPPRISTEGLAEHKLDTLSDDERLERAHASTIWIQSVVGSAQNLVQKAREADNIDQLTCINTGLSAIKGFAKAAQDALDDLKLETATSSEQLTKHAKIIQLAEQRVILHRYELADCAPWLYFKDKPTKNP